MSEKTTGSARGSGPDAGGVQNPVAPSRDTVRVEQAATASEGESPAGPD